MSKDNERLFLIELLIDKVTINYEKVGLDGLSSSDLRETCVDFRILDINLKVCEDDFCKNQNYKITEVPFKSGKSVLFSLRSLPRIKDLTIYVSVTRDIEDGCPLFIGKTCIPLGSSFTNILTAKKEACFNGPKTRTVKGTYNLCNNKCQNVGDITVFTRLSCFGNIIVTQFEVGNKESQSFHFKGATHKMCKSETKLSTTCPEELSNRRRGIGSCHQTELDSGDYQRSPCVPEKDVSYGKRKYKLGFIPDKLMSVSAQQIMTNAGLLSNTEQYFADIFSPPGILCPPGFYNQLGFQGAGLMSYTGGGMHYSDDSSSEEEESTFLQRQLAQLKFCDCDIPLPPGLFPCPTQNKKKKKKKRKKRKCPSGLSGKYCLNPFCPMGYPLPFGNRRW